MDNQLVEIFFVITAAAVIIITMLLAIVIIYAITIIRTIRRAVRTAEFAAELLKEDAALLRQSIKRRGFSLAILLDFLRHIGRRAVSPKRK